MTNPIEFTSTRLCEERAIQLDDMESAARSLGLKSIRAWVPDSQKRSRSASAERTKRSRDNAEARGRSAD